MIRSWGLQTLTGNAQPLFGDLLTAAFSNLKSEPHGFYLVTVAKASQYQVGDRIILGFGGATATNCLMVDKVNTVSNVLSCISEGDAPVSNWVNGTQIVLSLACAVLGVQAPTTNAGNIWFGSDSTVTNVGGGSAFGEIFPSGSFPFGIPQWNTIRTTEAWIAGTLNDKAGVYAIIV
jgi:hypothetical protein